MLTFQLILLALQWLWLFTIGKEEAQQAICERQALRERLRERLQAFRRCRLTARAQRLQANCHAMWPWEKQADFKPRQEENEEEHKNVT